MDRARTLTCDEWFRAAISQFLVEDSPEAYREATRGILVSLATQQGVRKGLTPGWDFQEVPIPESVLETADPGDLYQRSLAIKPVTNAERIVWQPDVETRRSAGAYYSPGMLIDRLLEFAVAPLLGRGTISVCDPACGAGSFLIRAIERCAVPVQSIFGFDIDPTAVELCRLNIWLHTGSYLPENIRQLDSLLLKDNFGGFDAIVSNPPFGSVIDGRVPQEIARLRPTKFAELSGTADLSYYFVVQAKRLVKRDGRIGLILPRAFLSAQSAKALRAPLDPSFQLLRSSDTENAFRGACVNVCLVGYQPTHGNGLAQALSAVPEPSLMDVRASLTVGEAYELAKSVKDFPHGRGLKFITTGLIERESVRWGVDRCRFLKKLYAYPRLAQSTLPPRRAQLAVRPKLLVAGLSRQLECYLDDSGECVGSVGTYTILHPEDDLRSLRDLMDYLHSPESDERFRGELGHSALSGGNITVTKRFLKSLAVEFEATCGN